MINPFYSSDETPYGWTPCLHPEGALYFMHEEKVCASLMSKNGTNCLAFFKRILTDAYLYDPRVISDATNFINQIFDYVRAHDIQLTSDVDLILDLTPNNDGNTVCGYYFANHTNRSVFWLDLFDANDLPAWSEVGSTASPSHLRMCLYSMNPFLWV